MDRDRNQIIETQLKKYAEDWVSPILARQSCTDRVIRNDYYDEMHRKVRHMTFDSARKFVGFCTDLLDKSTDDKEKIDALRFVLETYDLNTRHKL